MKVTVVPAQVTTVEDRIIGNLSPAQVLLIVSPVFIGAGLYAAVPPHMEVSLFKAIIIAAGISFSSLMALKVKDKLVLSWLVILLRYHLRPKYYLYDKNTDSSRKQYTSLQEPQEEAPKIESNPLASRSLDPALYVAAMSALNDPARQIRFKRKKDGGLYVHYTKIEE